jgi:hypothetical protein
MYFLSFCLMGFAVRSWARTLKRDWHPRFPIIHERRQPWPNPFV